MYVVNLLAISLVEPEVGQTVASLKNSWPVQFWNNKQKIHAVNPLKITIQNKAKQNDKQKQNIGMLR